MGELAREERSGVIKAMEPEELDVVVKAIPSSYMWAELMRRDGIMTGMLQSIYGVMGGTANG